MELNDVLVYDMLDDYCMEFTMNERIKTLIAEHGLHKYIAEDCQHRMEFLAKLVVEECASLFPLTFTDEQYQRRIDKTIKKHFGIE